MTDKKLFKKLVEILREVETIKKSGKNTHQGYQYTTESDLLEVIRPKLVEKGIFLTTSVVSVERVDNITTVITEHEFHDSETGETYKVNSAGQGSDKQDKGIYKAITGSVKYLLWKNFLVESNDDPENDGANPSYVREKSTKPKTGFGNVPKNLGAIEAEEALKQIKVTQEINQKVQEIKVQEGDVQKTFAKRTSFSSIAKTGTDDKDVKY